MAIDVIVIHRRKPYQIYNSFFDECQCCLTPVAIGANIMRHLRWSESNFTANIEINVDEICRLRENKSVFTANIEICIIVIWYHLRKRYSDFTANCNQY